MNAARLSGATASVKRRRIVRMRRSLAEGAAALQYSQRSMTTVPGVITHGEIFQQPDLWPDTVRRIRVASIAPVAGDERPVITGAGSSAYAATAIAAAWPGARAVPTTDLLLDAR